MKNKNTNLIVSVLIFYMAGDARIELATKVLETPIIPFN